MLQAAIHPHIFRSSNQLQTAIYPTHSSSSNLLQAAIKLCVWSTLPRVPSTPLCTTTLQLRTPILPRFPSTPSRTTTLQLTSSVLPRFPRTPLYITTLPLTSPVILCPLCSPLLFHHRYHQLPPSATLLSSKPRYLHISTNLVPTLRQDLVRSFTGLPT